MNVLKFGESSVENELNIKKVLDIDNPINTLHETFFNDDTKNIHLYIVGIGLIGRTLIDQINTQKQILGARYGINLNIRGIANSRKMYFSDELHSSEEWISNIQSSRKQMTINKFVDAMITENRRNTIFIDNTSSQEVVSEYARILNHSISISTPNKIAASADLKAFKELKKIAVKRGVKYGYETTVGAGLPVISTLSDLIKSGDEIEKIEAVLSGSLSYIFNNFDGEKKFSDVVKEAKALGFTEPDPREDLNGFDVCRKILILGREAGFDLEEKDVQLNFFLSESARKAKTVSTFFKTLEKDDLILKNYIVGLALKGKKPRMIAEYNNGKASVGVVEVDKDSPFYNLEGSDNMIVFTTKRYHERPLVISGPGAGAEVTAAGVLAEILRIANSI